MDRHSEVQVLLEVKCRLIGSRLIKGVRVRREASGGGMVHRVGSGSTLKSAEAMNTV